jgi:glycosyltransferase involved in cell wall biosynthesis
MRGCSALVVASHVDAAPRVIFEAMACRKPVVATRTNGACDYVSDGETGILCSIGDMEDLAVKLETLLRDPSHARAMGEAGFAVLDQKYSEACYIERMLGMLGDVLGMAPRFNASRTR